MAKVLLIDDDDALLTVFATALQKDGFATVTANDGASGIAKAKTEKPDFILLDQILPDTKGNDILQIFKQDVVTQAIPVALLSNFGQNELIQDAISHGAVDYILKYQIDPNDLVRKVHELIKEGQAGKEPTTTAQ